MIILKVLSERLRTQRKLKSKTQNDIAKALNISRAAYGEYELGNHLPTVDKLVSLAVILDVSIDYLLGLEDPKELNVIETLSFIIQNIKSGNANISGVVSEVAACSIENTQTIIKLIERSVM